VTSSLYRNCDLSLVLGAVSCITAGANFSCLRHETPHHINLLVVDDDAFIGAELAHTRPTSKTTSTTALVVVLLFVVFGVS
jgi:hypothetical protein